MTTSWQCLSLCFAGVVMVAGQKNWKECAQKNLNNGGIDTGLVTTCSFQKYTHSSYLKVRVSTDMRIQNCNSCCSRWYVTFDAIECPVPIDGVLYLWHGSRTQNIHRPRVIMGHCHVGTVGTVNVQLNVGRCKGYKDVADAGTGWNSSTRIFIEEVNSPQP